MNLGQSTHHSKDLDPHLCNMSVCKDSYIIHILSKWLSGKFYEQISVAITFTVIGDKTHGLSISFKTHTKCQYMDRNLSAYILVIISQWQFWFCASGVESVMTGMKIITYPLLKHGIFRYARLSHLWANVVFFQHIWTNCGWFGTVLIVKNLILFPCPLSHSLKLQIECT